MSTKGGSVHPKGEMSAKGGSGRGRNVHPKGETALLHLGLMSSQN